LRPVDFVLASHFKVDMYASRGGVYGCQDSRNAMMILMVADDNDNALMVVMQEENTTYKGSTAYSAPRIG